MEQELTREEPLVERELTGKEPLMNREFTRQDTQVVKGLAVLCLLLYHLFENYDRVISMNVIYKPLPLELFLMLTGFGNICVAVFVFLSAYGITKSLLQKDGRKIAGQAGKETGCVWKEYYSSAVLRYIRLTANFLIMFLSVNLLWFKKFDYKGLYGGGWQGLLYGLLDAFGLSGLFKTPTINETWWYMELAVMIIFFVPVLHVVAKRMGNYVILIAVLVPAAVDLSFDFKRYYFVILLGVLAAEKGWLEKLYAWKLPKILQALVGLLLFAACIVIRQNYVVYHEFAYLLDGPIALFFTWFAGEILGAVRGVRQVLALFGRHSMNIYFVHTFFYLAIYQQFIYSFSYAGLIFLVLAGISLLYSLVLQGLKKLCRFDKGMEYLNVKWQDMLRRQL